MTHPGPRLVADPPEPSARVQLGDPRKGTRHAFWILAVLVFACALAAAFQTRRVNELNGEVAALNGEVATLNGELSTARTHLDAYQGHLVEIRGAVSHLQTQLGALDELARQDPLAPASQ